MPRPNACIRDITRSEIEMNLLELAECRQCGHDDTEHLGACHTDIFAGGAWAKCDCESFVTSEAA
jgi:hypothetical protein